MRGAPRGSAACPSLSRQNGMHQGMLVGAPLEITCTHALALALALVHVRTHIHTRLDAT